MPFLYTKKGEDNVLERVKQQILLRKLVLTLWLFALSFVMGRAQYDAVFSQYTRSLSYNNPASVGAQTDLNITAAYHQQWIGITGAPANFLLSGNTEVQFLERKHGVGVTIMGQKKGLFTQSEISGAYAFFVPIGKGTLAIGLQGGLFTTSFDGTKVVIPDGEGLSPNDPAIPLTRVGGKMFDAAAGIIYRHPNFYVGFSSRHLFNPRVKLNETHYQYLRRNYILHGGTNIKPHDARVSWYPSLLVMTDLQSYRIDANVEIALDEKFFAGLMFRPVNAVGFNLGLKWSSFYFGYAFEMPITELVHGNWGSHELLMSYSIPMHKAKNKGVRAKSVRLL